MMTVVVLACMLIILFTMIIVLGSYSAKVKQQKETIKLLQQENEELKKKYDEILSLAQRLQRQKAMKANQTADTIQNMRDGPNVQN